MNSTSAAAWAIVWGGVALASMLYRSRQGRAVRLECERLRRRVRLLEDDLLIARSLLLAWSARAPEKDEGTDLQKGVAS